MMKNILLGLLALLALIPLASASGSMSFLLNYDKGEVSLREINLLEREPPDFISQPEEGFYASIFSFNNSILFARRFDFPLKDYDSPVTLDKMNYALIVPYFYTGQYFYVFDKDINQVIKYDISEYAVCNQNGVCNTDYGENAETCLEDCKAGMPVEETKAEEPAAELPAEEESPVKLSTDYIIIGALALVLVIIIIIALASRKNQSQ